MTERVFTFAANKTQTLEPMEQTASSLTLEQFCAQIRYSVAAARLQAWVTAELAEVQRNRGTYYADLVQKSDFADAPVAKLRCVIWAREADQVLQPFRDATGGDPEAGMKVMVFVSVSYHEVYGLSGKICAVDPAYTLGDLEARRRAILAQLAAEGVVDMNKSLPLPTVIRRVAIVSSETAAGYGDFCHQLASNAYGISFRLTLFPAAMQGDGAEASVVDALGDIAARADEFDVVAIIRGGGSKMDLACFDSYLIACNIAQFPLPVITGIGHERDHSIADAVAHTFAKTPTAVAEFIISHDADFLALLDDLRQRVVLSAAIATRDSRSLLTQLTMRLFGSSGGRLSGQRAALSALLARAIGAASARLVRADGAQDALRVRLLAAASATLRAERQRTDALCAHVSAIDPRAVLRRGFCVVTTADGKRLVSASDVAEGDEVLTYLASGRIFSRVVGRED